MVIVPGVFDDIEFLEKIRKLLQPAGFGSFSITTAEEHDEIIAFTSQLAHVVSNAYVKSPTARKQSGFSAGSYRDMTRVARLSPSMWSELFLENRVNLVREIDILIENLEEYKDALLAKDGDRLRALLAEGSDTKKEIDG
jgi:prephenate dehydrogenase